MFALVFLGLWLSLRGAALAIEWGDHHEQVFGYYPCSMRNFNPYDNPRLGGRGGRLGLSRGRFENGEPDIV